MYLDAPKIDSQDVAFVGKALKEGYISTFGPFISEFEKKCADFLKVDQAVAVQSGTAAIYLSLLEHGIGPGDEVIVPVLTFVASVNPIIYVGAKPVFVDIDQETLNIDYQQIEKNISSRTKAIIPVHLYGNPSQIDKINQIAKKHNLVVIEDAAESLGAQNYGQATGTFGHFGCFSFNGNKIITTGGGGLIVSSDVSKIEHIRFLINQAKVVREGENYHPEIGYNYRMTNLEASLGLGQMSKIKDLLAKKRRFYEIYKNEFSTVDCLDFQKEAKGSISSYWFTVVRFKDNVNLREIQSFLQERKIPTRRIWNPLVDYPPYKEYQKEDYPSAVDAYKHCLCLPSSARNSDEEIIFVCQTLKQIWE